MGLTGAVRVRVVLTVDIVVQRHVGWRLLGWVQAEARELSCRWCKEGNAAWIAVVPSQLCGSGSRIGETSGLVCASFTGAQEITDSGAPTTTLRAAGKLWMRAPYRYRLETKPPVISALHTPDTTAGVASSLGVVELTHSLEFGPR